MRWAGFKLKLIRGDYMSLYEKDRSSAFKIESKNVLTCSETGRVIAVFFNEEDLDEVVELGKGVWDVTQEEAEEFINYLNEGPSDEYIKKESSDE